jgi:hypothetical protein
MSINNMNTCPQQSAAGDDDNALAYREGGGTNASPGTKAGDGSNTALDETVIGSASKLPLHNINNYRVRGVTIVRARLHGDG